MVKKGLTPKQLEKALRGEQFRPRLPTERSRREAERKNAAAREVRDIVRGS
ncbi:MAG TPA: hypothetical protein VF053_06300 [Streptosporangiales bacterium]